MKANTGYVANNATIKRIENLGVTFTNIMNVSMDVGLNWLYGTI